MGVPDLPRPRLQGATARLRRTLAYTYLRGVRVHGSALIRFRGTFARRRPRHRRDVCSMQWWRKSRTVQISQARPRRRRGMRFNGTAQARRSTVQGCAAAGAVDPT